MVAIWLITGITGVMILVVRETPNGGIFRLLRTASACARIEAENGRGAREVADPTPRGSGQLLFGALAACARMPSISVRHLSSSYWLPLRIVLHNRTSAA